MLLMAERMLVAAALRDRIDELAGPEDHRAVQFTSYWSLLQGDPDFGPGWQEEAVRELLALSRSLAADGRRASEMDHFLLWLGKKAAAEELFVDDTKRDGLREWHTVLAATVTSATPWSPRVDGRKKTPIAHSERAGLVEKLKVGPLHVRRKKAEAMVGASESPPVSRDAVKGSVDRERARKKRP
jgi:hypothetical protein